MRTRTLLANGSISAAVLLALIISTEVTPVVAQVTTGKVQGRVTDAASGNPIALATVRIDGTTLGNLTNEAGFFFINDVPAGLQDVRAQVLGYRSLVIEAQRILAGQTTTLNFGLEQSAVELEALSVEGERNPLVPRDQVASKAIVQGQAVDLLPLDNVNQIVALQPGVYEELGCADDPVLGPNPTGCLTIRGGRPNEEAVYVDGVLVRSFGTGRAGNVQVPTNSLEQLDVTVGAFSAEFGEAQAGVISYVTRRGGARYTGSAEFHTDAFGPDDWYTGFNRLEANFGGPIYGPLTFFLAGTATGQDWFENEGMPDYFVIDGTDVCPASPQFEGLCTAGEPAVFRTPRSTETPGTTDSVNLAAPRFVRWEDGRTVPGNFTDELLFTGNLNLQLPRGSRINFGYTHNRFQNYSSVSGWWSQYRQDNVEGARDEQDVLSLTGYFTLLQSSTQQLALEVGGSYQASRLRGGMIDPVWYLDHRDPWLSFSPGNVRFLFDEDVRRYGIEVFRPTEEFVQAWRSGALNTDSLVLVPGDIGWGLQASETVAGLNHNLRSNPWGWYYGYQLSGVGAGGLSLRREDLWQFRASVDWQAGRFNRLKFGGEYLSVDMSSMELWIFAATGDPNLASPIRAGLFVQERLDVGDLVLEAGLRWDYLDPNVEYPRYPGFVSDVPDSLQAGFVRWDSQRQAFVPKFDVPCGGVTPENPNGICLENFIPMSTKSELSPRLGASFPVTPTSTFRLSYGRFVQTPAFFSFGDTFYQSLGAAQVDLLGGNARDVEMPSTSAFEFGYRQLIGQDLVLDLAAFYKKQRAGLTYRQVEFANPNSGLPGFATVLTNQDFTESTGFEIKVDKAIGNLFVGNLAYSYLDARGTGTDPWTYLDLINSQRTNLSFLTGEPVNPPETLLPLELGRRHNISLTTSLQFPSDYRPGTVVGAILRDFGLFTVISIRSGQRFTGFEYEGGYGSIGPPSGGGQVRTSLAALETPWQTQLDLRFSKGLRLGEGWSIQAFVDLRNPFDIAVTRQVFLDTGTDVHEAARERWLLDALADPRLDGDPEVDDFDIALESPETDFNKYMLMRAEQRWGNGDGVFTVDEQVRSFEPDWEHYGGTAAMRPSNQSLRLGLRVSF